MNSSPPPNDPVSENIGHRVRVLRQQRNLSVNELANTANVSSGIVSQIERGKANPSIRTLDRISKALAVPLTTILEGETREGASNDEFVRRKVDRLTLEVGPHSLVKEYLSPHNEKDLNLMFITFPPHSESAEVVRGPGEKAGLVVSGQVTLNVDGVDAALYEGDCFQFSSESPHQVINAHASEAKVLWIMSTALSVPEF